MEIDKNKLNTSYKKSTLAFMCCLLSMVMFAQQGINYKALIKDSSGNVIANNLVDIQFQILQGTSMTNVYQETHTLNTDANGLVIVTIGTGTTSDVFIAIDWASDTHFLNVQIDTGNGLTDMGTTQFMTVPYAISAANSATKINDLNDGKSNDSGSSLFLGTDAGLYDDNTDNINVGIGKQALFSNTTGVSNTGLGYRTLVENTTGNHNTAIGKLAGENNINGQRNTSVGSGAFQSNSSGNDNTAIGFTSLYNNTTGNDNTAIGRTSLYSNTTGNYNTANGKSAMYYNTTGAENTAVGHKALQNNTVGSQNTAIGDEALFSNNLGNFNSAIGYAALYYNTGGIRNTAIGSRALFSNTIGSTNTAVGEIALMSNTTGQGNTALGYWALVNKTTGGYNTAIGQYALADITAGTGNIGIGSDAQVPNATGSNQVRIGNTQITYAGIQVNWSATSDKRWKDNIRTLPYGLDVVKALRPVDYIRKNNETKTREMGFIAQDIEALLTKIGYTDQGFLHKDDNGFMSLRYNDFIALLTKAIQEQQVKIESLQSEIKTQGIDYRKILKRVEQIEVINNQ